MPAVVHTIHGMPFGAFESPLKNRLYITLERWAAYRCHAIVSVCATPLPSRRGCRSGPAGQVPDRLQRNGHELCLNPRCGEEVRRELGLADDEVAFATVARLFELKGHDDIVAVAAAALKANPKVRFVWIGDGVLRDRLIADLQARGIRTPSCSRGSFRPTASPHCWWGSMR